MDHISRAIVKMRFFILVGAFALLIPSLAGYLATRVNYDILSYLPSEIETMKGQDILMDEFGSGAFSLLIMEGMENKEIVRMKEKIENVEHVEKVIWYDSIMDISTPMELLPKSVYDAFNNADEDATMMFVIFDGTTSSDETMEAVTNIRSVVNEHCFLSGMSAIVTDNKHLAITETPLYVAIAVLLVTIVMAVTMDSFLVPFLFLISIGLAIMYNLGSNIFFGEISFITKALAAVLQLGVTMDYSIFLWHSYQEMQEDLTRLGWQPKRGGFLQPAAPGGAEASSGRRLHVRSAGPLKREAMARAITMTFQSIVGSSITTVAGFVALCFMSFTLGLDLGVVMSKGVVLGVISCVTVLPSLILTFDGLLEKTKHRPLLPEFERLPVFITRHYKLFGILFLIILPFAVYGNNNTKVYYDLVETMPDDYACVIANNKLKETFATNNAFVILADASVDTRTFNQMTEKLKKVDGVESVLSLDAALGSTPADLIPDKAKESLESDAHKLVLVNSAYSTATDEINDQIDAVNAIVKGYDATAMIVGEAPATKDLIDITAHDFMVVSWTSIGMVFVIILFVMKSISLPFILVAIIEFAIFINMGIPAYTGTVIPFISSVVIGTIQLGATVDYAILMTTRYCRERADGADKKEATTITLTSNMKSVIVSALSFFAATFGVGLVASMDMISSLCLLMARGALVSMVVVLTVLPAMYMIFDPLIIRTTMGFKELRARNREVRHA